MKKILATSQKSCLAQAPCGRIHFCYGQVHFDFTRYEMNNFIKFIRGVMSEMDAVHGFRQTFFETGIPHTRIVLSRCDLEEMDNLLNEGEIVLSISEILEVNQ